jgi:hypothetical protein
MAGTASAGTGARALRAISMRNIATGSRCQSGYLEDIQSDPGQLLCAEPRQGGSVPVLRGAGAHAVASRNPRTTGIV